jgi:ArsR family metal-binding transcriptional regulator
MAQFEKKEVVEDQKFSMAQMLEFAKTLGAEIRKPDDETQAKIDEAKARKIVNAKAMAEIAREEIANKQAAQDRCGHQNEKGKNTFAGQVLSNGDAVVACQRCQKEFRWKATQEQVQGGLGLQDVDRGLSFVTEAHLLQWEKIAPPTKKAKRKGA